MKIVLAIYLMVIAVFAALILWLAQPHVRQEQLTLIIPEGAKPGDRLVVKETSIESPLWMLVAREPEPVVTASLIPQGTAAEREDAGGAI